MRKSKNIVATIKEWNLDNYRRYCSDDNFSLIKKNSDLKLEEIKALNPDYIFFPHWSWLIPKEIWSKYDCVVFHMTELPYGRGGSPLQNLILRGKTRTKISAFKVNGGLDTGDIYCQRPLSLAGSAEEIYKRASEIIFKMMIPYIIKNRPKPEKQRGKAVRFNRRNPFQSKINDNLNVKELYDFIRMLDAPGYPKAFLETEKLRMEFFRANFKNHKLSANVNIYAK